MANQNIGATSDSLTVRPGYGECTQRLADEMLSASISEKSLSLVLFDIDWFGKLNASLGRHVGDRVIQILGDSLSDTLAPAGIVYRYGGDAFVVLFPGCEKEQAFLRAEEARTAFSVPWSIESGGKTHTVELTISAGVAASPDDGTKDVELLRKCNEALYRAKLSGRNKVCLAREEKMVTKTTYYTQGQLEGLSRLAKREGLNEAVLLREAMDDLLRKYNS